MNLIDNKDLLDKIEFRIKQHHKLYDLPLIAEYWEEVFAKSIEDVEGYSDWLPDRSHSVGKDQICTLFGKTIKISNKSGKYNPSSNTLQISGSRSGEYKTLRQKLKFFSDKQEDVYVCLATSTKKPKMKEYYFFSFDTSILDYDKVEWTPKMSRQNKQVGWQCKTDTYYAAIYQSLSGQLWTTINLDSANIKPEVIKID